MDIETQCESAMDAQSSRRKFLAVAAASAAVIGLGTQSASAAPNGTRPTVLTVTSVAAINSTQMRITGRLTLLSGAPVTGMRVDIYSVFEASFTRWSTVYTDGSGNFSSTSLKVPVGAKIQVVVDGNGAYSQPFPTYNRV